MNIKGILGLFVLLTFSTIAMAQASGGQIVRKPKTVNVQPKKRQQIQTTTINTGAVNDSWYTNSLNDEYNIVVSSFMQRNNVVSCVDKWKSKGYDAFAYNDKKHRLYRIVISHGNSYEWAINYYNNYIRNNPDTPDAWIMQYKNGETRKVDVF